MKKKITILLILLDIILILINVASIGVSYQDNKKYLSSIEVVYDNNLNSTNSKLNDIVGTINLSKSYYLVQGHDNTFYQNHGPNKEKNNYGSIFIDYRCNLLEDDACYIYSHSSNSYDLPFNELLKYQDIDYFNNHKYIKISYFNYDLLYEVVAITSNYEEYQGPYLYLQTCKLDKTGLIILALKRLK